jgi:hypothetical protein
VFAATPRQPPSHRATRRARLSKEPSQPPEVRLASLLLDQSVVGQHDRGHPIRMLGEARFGLRRRSSANWVEFEDTSALGRLHRMVEIDTVDDANEPDTKRSASRERTEDVAKEANSLCRVQLGRADLFFPAAHRDRRAAGSA